MSNPMISIVMAAKNVEPYLVECLDSIINQTFKNWELILVDDHSTDETARITKNYCARDERVRYFLSEGQRLNPALITAQKHIRGKFINRMDADDIMPLDKLETMMEALKDEGEGTIVAGGTKHFTEEGEVGAGFLRYDAWLNDVAKKGSHWSEIYRECVIPSHCWLVHTTDFIKIGGFASVYPEDYDLCFRFYQHGLKVKPLAKVLHFWRDRMDRISRSWEEYKDNRYFDLKLKYFFEIDSDPQRPLIIWGAGKNGKDLVKKMLERNVSLRWVCNNDQKIGKDIYGVRLEAESIVNELENPQVLIAVSAPDERVKIAQQLKECSLIEGQHYWFFL